MKLETKNLIKNYIVPKSGEVKVLKGIEDRMKKWFASFSRLRGGLRP